MLDFRSPHYARRFIMMLLAIFIMGAGVHLFRLSLTGNDPSTALVIAVNLHIKVPFSILLIIFNSIYFIIEFITNRKLIGPGTFINWFFVGVSADVWAKIMEQVFKAPTDMTSRIILMAAGVIILSFSAALYQTANLGIGTYDSVSITMSERLQIKYFCCRIITDGICALIAYLLGGIIGLGTLICALGLGPVITFFTKTCARKMCGYKKGEKTII